MSGRAGSGPRTVTSPYQPGPCPRCTGYGDAHYLTCPTLQLATRRQRCVYCGLWSYRRGWGCSSCGACTVEDFAALQPLTLLEASDVMNRRLADAAAAGLSVREAVAAWARGEGDVPP